MATKYTWKLTSPAVFGQNLNPTLAGKPYGCHHLHTTLEVADCCKTADRWLNRGYSIVATDDRGKSFRQLSDTEKETFFAIGL